MSSLWEALHSVFGSGEDIAFLSSCLQQYRETRKLHAYEYTEEDKEALRACASDLRPLSYSFLPGGAAFWGLGKLVRRPAALPRMSRIVLAVVRLAAAAEVFRVGYLVGSYRQGMDCTRRLVSLRSPLGGEIAAIIRQRDPAHPLLKYERPPAEMHEDGSRPRIASEAARQAQIAQLQAELAAAKAGRATPRQREDDLLASVMRQRDANMEELERGGGAAAAMAAGRLEAARPAVPQSHRATYEAAAAGGGTMVAPGGGLIISDRHPAAEAQQAAAVAAAAHAGAAALPGPSRSSSSGAGDDPLAMLLDGSGGGWGEEGSEEARRAAEAEAARRQRRAERRKQWWRRKSHGGGEEE